MERAHVVTKEKNLALRLCLKSFRKHVLVEEGPGRWFFGKPGDNHYHFRVITSPGVLVYTGDLGHVMLQVSDRDPIAWVRGTIAGCERGRHSYGYIAEKIVASSRKMTEPSQVLVDDYLREWKRRKREVEKSHKALYQDAIDDFTGFDISERGEREFWELAYKHHDDEPPTIRAYTHDFYLTIEALRVFTLELDKK